MFIKIRNRILLLNMAMISTVAIAAFVVIFFISYSRVQRENQQKLENYAVGQFSIYESFFQKDNTAMHTEPFPGRVSGFAQRISPGAGLSFSLLTDSQGEIVEVNSMVELPDAAYRQAALDAAKLPQNSAILLLEGRRWQFSSRPVTLQFQDPSGIWIAVSGEYQHIRFLDVTDSYKMLGSLALTLSGITLAILAVFFFISRFFANRAIQPMEEAWEKQIRFIADASHELKTPLSVISANCGVLSANKEETVESQLKWVNHILSGADRMNGLINNLLSLAQMEEGQSGLQLLRFDLSETVEGAVAEIEAAALEKGIGVNRRIEADIAIESDQARLKQVLDILFDNAVKYTDHGGEISVSLIKRKRHIECAVRNSGEGIAAQHLPLLFDRFYRADPARTSENGGYGLGLAIAKATAEQLGAKLSANSSPGEYTEFILTLEIKSWPE